MTSIHETTIQEQPPSLVVEQIRGTSIVRRSTLLLRYPGVTWTAPKLRNTRSFHGLHHAARIPLTTKKVLALEQQPHLFYVKYPSESFHARNAKVKSHGRSGGRCDGALERSVRNSTGYVMQLAAGVSMIVLFTLLVIAPSSDATYLAASGKGTTYCESFATDSNHSHSKCDSEQ